MTVLSRTMPMVDIASQTPDSAQAPSQEAGSAAFASRKKGSRIWVLDDDTSLCKLLQRQIEAAGWTCLTFHHGKELGEMITISSPDLLVLDQMLPDQPGTQLLAWLRQIGHRFPVLMLSALGAPDDRIHGLEEGADDYLSKPFTAKELLLRIDRLLAQASGPAVQLEEADQAFLIDGMPFRPALMQVEKGSDAISLSRGEAALLTSFCQAPGLILSREQLARGSGSLVDVNNSRSLDMRISKLRRQLNGLETGLGDKLEAVRGRGYRLNAVVNTLGETG